MSLSNWCKQLFKKKPRYICRNCGTEFHEDDTCPCGTEAIIQVQDDVLDIFDKRTRGNDDGTK